MRKSLIFIILLAGCLGVSAQSLRTVWIEMPDSIIPYLSRSQRTELVDYVDMKAEPAVRDALGDTVRIERMTDSYLSVRLSRSSRLEIRLLDKSTLALVRRGGPGGREQPASVQSALAEEEGGSCVSGDGFQTRYDE